jgi:lipid-A-disaccharide synthase-like uncharacterized protein
MSDRKYFLKSVTCWLYCLVVRLFLDLCVLVIQWQFSIGDGVSARVLISLSCLIQIMLDHKKEREQLPKVFFKLCFYL